MTPVARKKIITYFFNLGKAKYGESWRCRGSGLGMLHVNIGLWRDTQKPRFSFLAEAGFCVSIEAQSCRRHTLPIFCLVL